MLVDWNNKCVNVKIVYYGPAMSGKTTSLKKLFEKVSPNQHVKSLETSTGRTLFFDYAPLSINQKDWTIQVEVWSATGQDYYAETRLTVLADTDGIIFVADSQRKYAEENLRSWKELISFFGDKLEKEIPVVVSMNKYDLGDVISEDDLRAILKSCKSTVYIRSVAVTGFNVVESFKTVLEKIFHQNF
ncbi:MAG: GTP-binding protein [Candidatus Odinarchaeota archaeon]